MRNRQESLFLFADFFVIIGKIPGSREEKIKSGETLWDIQEWIYFGFLLFILL